MSRLVLGSMGVLLGSRERLLHAFGRVLKKLVPIGVAVPVENELDGPRVDPPLQIHRGSRLALVGDDAAAPPPLTLLEVRAPALVGLADALMAVGTQPRRALQQ